MAPYIKGGAHLYGMSMWQWLSTEAKLGSGKIPTREHQEFHPTSSAGLDQENRRATSIVTETTLRAVSIAPGASTARER